MNQNQLRLFVDLVLHKRYKIINELGRGGMGTVYEAIDLHQNNAHVAIKQLLPRDFDLRQAFEREADILSRLNHTQLPRVSDHFEEETGLFMAMQFIPGYNLGQLLNSRPLPFPPHQVKAWAEDLLQTIDYLHSREPRTIHRDIKPSNLKLAPTGRIVLLDFGLAREIAEPDNHEDPASDFCMIAYTPHYAPPEQIQGQKTGCYSDIYALGATLYHLITGTPPIDALKRLNQKRNQSTDPLRPISEVMKGVPQPLALMIMRALALNPEQRPQSARDMLAHLKAGTIAPRFASENLTTQATLFAADNTVASKPSVLSDHKPGLRLAQPTKINIQIPAPVRTELPDRRENVIAFSRFRKEQEKRELLTAAIPKLANIASAILILVAVATLARYVSHSVNPPIEKPQTAQAQTSTGNFASNYAPNPKQTTRNISYNYVAGAPPLPESLTLDDLARFRSRYLKRKNRIKPSNIDLTSQLLAEASWHTQIYPPSE